MLFNETSFMETMLDVMPFCVYVIDASTYEIIYMNKAMIFTRKNYTGETCHKVLYEEDSPCIFCKLDMLLDEEKKPNGKTYTHEHFNEFEDKWYQVQVKAIVWPNGKVVMYTISVDISELKEAQNRLGEAHANLALKNNELEVLSVTDPLTAVCNRMKLDKTISQELDRTTRYGSTFSLIMLDLDNFKKVNDTHGHLVGDRVLISIANKIQQAIRVTDTLGRWGGEEFMIILPEQDYAQTLNIAEKLRKCIEATEHNNIGNITASFGVTQYQGGDSIEEMTKRADDALYNAKNNGKNRVEGSKE